MFILSALVLMGGQSGAAVAIELFTVSAITAVAGIFSFRQAVRSGQRVPRGSLYRTLGGTACYICEMIGVTRDESSFSKT